MLKQSPKQTAIARKLRKADTWAEQLLWRWLRDRRFSAYKFRRQHPMGPHILEPRPTGRRDCNWSAMAGFAAAHG